MKVSFALSLPVPSLVLVCYHIGAGVKLFMKPCKMEDYYNLFLQLLPYSCFPCATASAAFVTSHLRLLALCFSSSNTFNYTYAIRTKHRKLPSLCECVCVCACVCTCVCMRMCVCMCEWVHMCVGVHVCMYVYVCMCVCV